MLQAKADWYWCFDSETQSLRLNMTDFVFVTACKPKKLVEHAKITKAFGVDDNQAYSEYFNIIDEQLNVSEAQAVQIALNAVAQQKYTIPEPPKSWYFIVQHHLRRDLFEQVVLIQSKYESGIFLILEENTECAFVMLLSASLQLNENKSMQQFDTIKVMQNRMTSLQHKYHSHTRQKNRA